MANLTITVDDDLLRRARMQAIEKGTSVNAILRAYLEAFAGGREARTSAVERLLDLSRRSGSRRAKQGWTREDLHER